MRRLLPAALVLVAVSAAVAQSTPSTQPAAIPPGEEGAKARLNSSPRHGEFIDITVPGRDKPVKAYIVYPERADKAPVVIVTMEIFGLSDWLRGVTDQLAADGFIAIAPDYLTGKGPNGGGTEAFPDRDSVVRAVQGVSTADVIAINNAARDYGMKLPAASGKTASIGFCWGGGKSFAYAAAQPDLNAAVVYYGTPPADPEIAKIKCPVLAFYGAKDNRVTSTEAPTAEKMKNLGKSFTPHIYDGAGHGFLRAQGDPANLKASEEAWPLTIQFLRENTK
ncbi:MAG TPA: dienelactone hydrolase family protein [Phycisphaerae bacterium]|nr:dienelactone hydrolase family protein [Phycisphaerae bacterium]